MLWESVVVFLGFLNGMSTRCEDLMEFNRAQWKYEDVVS